MKISNELSVGLKRLSNSALVTDNNFQLLIKNLIYYFSNFTHDLSAVPSNAGKIEVLKETYSALFCFLVECVRRNADVDTITSHLENARFPQDKIDQVLSVYLNHKKTVHRHLSHYALKPHRLFNVSWKMNFCVKSNFSSLEGVTVYYITMDIRDSSNIGSGHKKVTFICTVQHLQELVSSLRVAVRKLDSIAALSANII